MCLIRFDLLLTQYFIFIFLLFVFSMADLIGIPFAILGPPGASCGAGWSVAYGHLHVFGDTSAYLCQLSLSSEMVSSSREIGTK